MLGGWNRPQILGYRVKFILKSKNCRFNGHPFWYHLIEVMNMTEEEFKAILSRLDSDGLEIVYLLMQLVKRL